MNNKQLTPHVVLALVLFLTGLFLLPAKGAVEAVQVALSADSGSSTYAVPAGKVLIIEQIIFTDRWDNLGEDKRVVIRHGGTSIVGQVWQTTQQYSANWNQLLRPLSLPAGTAISCPNLDTLLFKVFLYGKLADQSDLFARLGTEIKDVQVSQNGNVRTISGTAALASTRPAKLVFEKSNDLKTWTMLDDMEMTSEESFVIENPTETPRQFVRAITRLRPPELLPRIFQRGG